VKNISPHHRTVPTGLFSSNKIKCVTMSLESTKQLTIEGKELDEVDFTNFDFSKLRIKNLRAKRAKKFIKRFHYSHGCHNGPSPNYGLMFSNRLIGVCMFATPCSENVRASILGKEHKDAVIELHRLYTIDDAPKNCESWFVSRCLNKLKEDKTRVKVVISFSDTTEGHYGTIYQACNAWYYGKSSPATFYKDKNGRLRHPRQQGENISKEEAKNKGWTPVKRDSKHRYLWIIDNNLTVDDLEVEVSKDYPKKD